MGRRWTVPPSAATMSASQCGGGAGRSSGAPGVSPRWVVLCSVTWVVRVEAEVGEGRAPGAHDGPVDARLGESVPAREAGVAALRHVGRWPCPQTAPDDVLAPGFRDLRDGVERRAGHLGEQVGPGTGHAAHEAVTAPAEDDPPSLADLVGQLVHRLVAGALAIDGEGEIGERVLV